MRLTFCLCHMVYKTTRKEYGILQTRHTDVCLDKADGVCRREVGMARLTAVTLPCLDCLIIHIHSYLYCYPYYFISILLHYHIDVLTYCYIVFISTLSYICIALFISIWIYRNIIISITGNLDSKNGKEVMELLSELHKEGTTIVMVTHSLHDANYADRIINMFDGEIVNQVEM